MTRSEIFRIAHDLTRGHRGEFASYREAFGVCLRAIYQAIKKDAVAIIYNRPSCGFV